METGETTFDNDTDVHIAASLMKQYLRDMPQPLIPCEKYPVFVAAASIGIYLSIQSFPHGAKNLICIPSQSETDQQMRMAVKQALASMPLANRITIKYLMRFLCTVSKKSDINKMTPANIAIVFAPNILRPPSDDIFTQMSDSSAANRLFQAFVIHFDELFAVNFDFSKFRSLITPKLN